MRLQVKLLRVLQENNIRPIGATDAIPVNVRVISATHRDLQQLMMSGQFREDLYYRLNVVHIEMPPLNRRREDIPLLVSHFLAQISNESGVRKIYAPEAVELLATADWPGNIRQLANVVRQNVALSQTPIIPVELVQQSLGGTQSKLPSFDEARDEFTRSYLSQILQITGGNVSQAARLAKRNRTDFYKLLSRHQLTPEDFKGSLRKRGRPYRPAQTKTAPEGAVFVSVLVDLEKVLDLRVLRRRNSATPTRPRPSSASVPGSGTERYVRRTIRSSWLSSVLAPESSHSNHAVLPPFVRHMPIDWKLPSLATVVLGVGVAAAIVTAQNEKFMTARRGRVEGAAIALAPGPVALVVDHDGAAHEELVAIAGFGGEEVHVDFMVRTHAAEAE